MQPGPPLHETYDARQTPPVRPGDWPARVGIVGASMLLFVIACALPSAYFLEPTHEPWSGAQMLGLGVFSIFYGQFGWFANPIMVLALVLVLCRLWLTAAATAFFAFLVGLLSLTMIRAEIPLDEGGVNTTHCVGLGPGFYVWLLAMLVVVAGGAAMRVLERK